MTGRTLSVVLMAVVGWSPTAAASCGYVAPSRIRVKVLSCKAADPEVALKRATKGPKDQLDGLRGAYAGSIVTATATPAKSGGKAEPLTVFVARSEAAGCAALKKSFDATLNQACCDGDWNPPCLLGLGEYLTNVSQ